MSFDVRALILRSGTKLAEKSIPAVASLDRGNFARDLRLFFRLITSGLSWGCGDQSRPTDFGKESGTILTPYRRQQDE